MDTYVTMKVHPGHVCTKSRVHVILYIGNC